MIDWCSQTNMHLWTLTCACMLMQACPCAHTHTHACTPTHNCINVCVYVCVCVCVCTHTHTNAHTHTHTESVVSCLLSTANSKQHSFSSREKNCFPKPQTMTGWTQASRYTVCRNSLMYFSLLLAGQVLPSGAGIFVLCVVHVVSRSEVWRTS